MSAQPEAAKRDGAPRLLPRSGGDHGCARVSRGPQAMVGREVRDDRRPAAGGLSLRSLIIAIILAPALAAQGNPTLGVRARQYLLDLIRLDTTNPPGNETRVAQYLKKILDQEGIPCELLGSEP